jgi:hypothetical protein
MATVLEEYNTEEQRSVVRFCGQNDSMQRIFIKKCFLFTVGTVYHVKRFTAGLQTFLWWQWGWNGGVRVAETTVKRLLCCGFWRSGKAMGQMYECWWGICREINVISFEYHMFYVLYPFETHLLTLLHRKDLEGNGPGLIKVLSRHFTWGTEESYENSVRIAFVPAEIWTKYVPNRNAEHYRYASLYGIKTFVSLSLQEWFRVISNRCYITVPVDAAFIRNTVTHVTCNSYLWTGCQCM